MPAFAQNLRFAFRQLRKSPGFSLTVILTLALGIGATTAIFSLVEGVLLRPLPFAVPERLVILGDHVGRGTGNTSNLPVSPREIGTYSSATSAFSSMGAFIGISYELSGGAVPEAVQAERLTTSMFSTLGVSPILGRTFTQEEEDGHQQLAVISYALWRDRYHLDPHVLGSSIVLSRKSYSIIGVMPRDFEFPLQPGHFDQVQLWVPMSLTPTELSDENAGYWGFHMVARLKDGVTRSQAANDADRVAKLTMQNFPASIRAIRIQGDVRLLREYFVAQTRPLLSSLLFAVAVVLLIACGNVAGLLLVRAIRRRREYAVRLALGARAGVILRESIFEGLLLSVTGGLLGLAFASAAIRLVLHLLPESMPRINSISINAVVGIFALVLALTSGILCSLAPAFAALRTNLVESLKEGSRTGIGGSSHAWLRSALVVSEIGIALVLLTVSGAFLRSFQKMRAVDPGFTPDHVLVASYQLPSRQYSAGASVENFNRSVIDQLSSKPAVVAAGLTSALPSTGASAKAGYTIDGVAAKDWKLEFAQFSITYGDYFRAMDIPVLEGRTFTQDDRSNSLLVMVVNQTMAKHCWPGQSAIGKRMHAGNPRNPLPWATVVGVVADTKLGSRDEPNEDQWYMSAEQPGILFRPDAAGDISAPGSGYITLRSSLPPEQMTQILRSTIAEIDPLLALHQVQPMDDVISSVEAPRRFNTDLTTAFAAGALLLALIGIYAVVAFSVSLRTKEMAIRMALGSQRGGIARLVLVSGAKLALLGCGLGVLGSLAASRLVSSFLFKVSATDPVIYTGSVLLMILMALLASVLPAIRAASADPIEALKNQ
ncbi:MAG TPA: ABC transporter permease [Candidatus Angelobacter sp.]